MTWAIDVVIVLSIVTTCVGYFVKTQPWGEAAGAAEPTAAAEKKRATST